MNIELVSTEGLVKTFKAVVSADDIQTQKAQYIKNRASKVKIDGFRPGKAPAHILEQRLGGDALNHVLRTSIDKAIKSTTKDHGIRALGEPKVDFDSFDEGKDLSFSMVFESMPTIELKDLNHIELEKIAVDVKDKDVTDALSKLKDGHKSFKIEEGRAASKDDRIACELSVSQDGKPISEYQKVAVTLDLAQKDFVFPEVNAAVMGKKSGDDVTFSSKASEKFGDKKIAGKTVDVSIHIKDVLAPQTFELNDDFAKEFQKETLDDLKKALKESLENEYNAAGRLYMKRHLLDALEKEYTFDLPVSMVTNEFDNIWGHLQSEIKSAEDKGEEVDNEGKTDDEVRTEYEAIAKRRVKLG